MLGFAALKCLVYFSQIFIKFVLIACDNCIFLFEHFCCRNLAAEKFVKT